MAVVTSWWNLAQRRDRGPEVQQTPEFQVIHDTDDTLDRLSARTPRAADLDDPLVALLAEFATDLDLGVPAPEATRNALSRRGQWPPRQDGVPGRVPGPVTELFRVPAAASDDVRVTSSSSRTALRRAVPEETRPRPVVALMAPPTRVLGFRLLPAVAAAAAGVVLSVGAAAALAGGGLTATMVNRMMGRTGPQGPTQQQTVDPSPGPTRGEPSRRGGGAVAVPSSGGADPAALPTASTALVGAATATTGQVPDGIPSDPGSAPAPDPLGDLGRPDGPPASSDPQIGPRPTSAQPTSAPATSAPASSAPASSQPPASGGTASAPASSPSPASTVAGTRRGNPSPPGRDRRPERKKLP